MQLLPSSLLLIALGALGVAFGLELLGDVFASLLVDHLHGETDLAALVHAEELHLHLVAFLDHIRDLADAVLGELRDVHEAVAGTEEVHEGAELHHLHDRALVDRVDLGLGHDGADPVVGRLDRLAVGRRDLDEAVVVDVDLRAGLLHDLADDLAARTDDFADLVDRDLHGLDARSMLAELGTGRGERLVHLFEDVGAAFLGLIERDAHDLLGDAGDLDVHLEGRDALLRSGHLEVHVAEVILVAENVGQDRIALTLEDEAHGDARHRTAQRHARIHQGERGAADGGHGRGAVRLGDLADDADRVGEVVSGRQHRMDGAPGELAMADFAAAGRAHAARLTDGVGWEVVVQQEGFLAGALQLVDELLVLAGAERRNHESLRFAAGEHGRAVGAGQNADLGKDLANGLEVAAVEARAGVEDVPAHDLGLHFLEGRLDLLGLELRLAVGGKQP